uniref:Rifin n=1 Tax=CrAss-like virus sp. ctelJ1 TaxID=2825838 RepID=A0A8S5V2J5_9CAUD|nr:MAG TPA: Rifin [CrAss-like virus sp. ctelJ1]
MFLTLLISIIVLVFIVVIKVLFWFVLIRLLWRKGNKK